MRYIIDFKNVDCKRHRNVYERLIKELQDFINVESIFAEKVRFVDMTWGYYMNEVIEIDEPKFLEELDNYFAPYEIEKLSILDVDEENIDGVLTIDATYMIMNIFEATLDNMKGE